MKKTGFDLESYHSMESFALRVINQKNTFTGLRKNCVSCHSTKNGYFNHSVTGIKLDETHIEFYCENCHQHK